MKSLVRKLNSRIWHIVLNKQFERNASRRSSSFVDVVTDGCQWVQPVGHATGINVYNSLVKAAVPMVLRREKTVHWYMCGPTVYDHSHIGHASCYVKFDIIRRIMEEFFELDVILLMGITDIDDKIITKANQLGTDVSQVAKDCERSFSEDMRSLRVRRPAATLRVTDFVPAILSFVHRLIEKNFAYITVTGSVYFDVAKYGDKYGRLRSTVGDPAQPSTAPVDSEKRNAVDFALWKAAKAGEPSWDSPWGRGRPGWHVECSAIASYMFGDKLDIHSGGIDLLFPHHENELAQCCAYHGVNQWVNYWMHSGHVQMKAQKMSKSLNNTIMIKEFLEKHRSDQFRIFCMKSHYRRNVDYSDDLFDEAKAIHGHLYSFVTKADTYIRGGLQTAEVDEVATLQKLDECKTNVMDAFRNDFNTSLALENILTLVTFVNKQLQKKTATNRTRSPAVVAAVSQYIKRFAKNVGIDLSEENGERERPAIDWHSAMDAAVTFRKQMRTLALNKNRLRLEERTLILNECDHLRSNVLANGIAITDEGSDSYWTIKKH